MAATIHKSPLLKFKFSSIPKSALVMIIFFSSLLKIEKTNFYQVLGVIFSMLGVIVIVTQLNEEKIKELSFNKGDLSIIIAMLSWALYSALLKKNQLKLSQLSLLQVIISSGLIFLLPIYIVEMNQGHTVALELPFILTLIYVVLFPGLASFICWIKGIGLIGVNRSGIFLHLMPIFSTIMAILIFNEQFMIFHLVGAIFIISGIFLSSKGRHV